MGNLSNLPSDILLDIITRLPTQSIRDCKLVCRPWRNLVSHHPAFSRLHLTRLSQYSSDSGEISFLVLVDYEFLYYFEYNEKHDQTSIHSFKWINLTPRRISYFMVGSVNGFYCLYEYYYKTFRICNRVTGEYVMLPKVEIDREYDHCSSGFGYLPLTNEYKVVTLCSSRRHASAEVAVYTLGSGEGWRNVGRQGPRYFDHHGGAFVNGVLHWVDRRGVLAFDLTEEKFEYLSPPPCIIPSSMRQAVTIGVLDGVLYYSIRYNCHERTYVDIWLLKKKNDIRDMKEQVEHEWSREFCLLEREPLAFTKSGGVLYYDDNSLSLSTYNASALTSKKLEYIGPGFGSVSQMLPHKRTSVSLRALREPNIQRMEIWDDDD